MRKECYRKISPGLVGLFLLITLLTGCGQTDPTAPPPPPPPTATPEPPPTETAGALPPSASPTAVSEAESIVLEEEMAAEMSEAEATKTTSPPPPSPEAAQLRESSFFGYTHQQPDGNRLAEGRGAAPVTQPLDIPLAGQPTWLVAIPNPAGAGSLWVATLVDGSVQAFAVANGDFEEVTLNVTQLPPGMPPLLYSDGQTPLLLDPPAAASPLTHPVLLPDGRMAFIDTGGDLVFWEAGAETARLPVEALPDARILVDEQARLLLLTNPTDRYAHAVVGDNLEAAGITLIETDPAPSVLLTIPISEPEVVEGIAPIWADLSGDGEREIIVTVSNPEQGAQLRLFNEAGEPIAGGPAIGRGNRWRHQIAVAPSGPDNELELIDIHTPHLGRITEFFRLTGAALELVAESQENYTSHFLGSRNLDMAAVADFDGDGRLELLLPNADASALGAIRRTAGGAEVVWVLSLSGQLATNLATTLHGEAGLALGVGRGDGSLRLWLP